MKKNENEENYDKPYGDFGAFGAFEAFTRQVGLNILKLRKFTDTELLAICNSIEGGELGMADAVNPDFIRDRIQETYDLGEREELEELIEKTEDLQFIAIVTLYYEVSLFIMNAQSWEEFKKKLTEQVYKYPILLGN